MFPTSETFWSDFEMPKTLPLTATTRHVMLFDEDWAYLEARFGPMGIQPVGVSAVIRAIIHQKVMSLRTAEIEARDQSTRQHQPS